MNKKIGKIVAVTAIAGGSLLATAGSASAGHYCKTTPSGVHQTNGNGNRGGGEWRSSSVNNPSGNGGIENAEQAGALHECSPTAPLPAPNNP